MTNTVDGNETEEAEDSDGGAAQLKQPAKKTRTTKGKGDDVGVAKPKAKRAPKAKKDAIVEEIINDADDDVMRVSALAPQTSTGARKPKANKHTASVEPMKVIPETQPEPMEEIEQSIEIEQRNMDITEGPTPRPAQRFAQRARSTSRQPQTSRARSTSRQPQPVYPYRRAGSASDTERRGADPDLRKKLSDITKKYENLDLKYRNLQEVGTKHAESNFEKLKRASDQKEKDANDLIASLKKEVAELRKSSSATVAESKGLKSHVETLTTDHERLCTEKKALQSSLQQSQNEAKALEAKLAATRKESSVAPADAKVPGSAVKSRDMTSRILLAGSTETAKEAKLREDLYQDLTGLIIRGVKRQEGEDVYD
ncbi:hypothetical protein LTR28_001919, partial [Elasticomyces elasticus]